MHRFDDSQYYRPADPAMRIFGTEGSLALQRHRDQGPPFHRMGRRILYFGRDLNEYLDKHRVEPRAA